MESYNDRINEIAAYVLKFLMIYFDQSSILNNIGEVTSRLCINLIKLCHSSFLPPVASNFVTARRFKDGKELSADDKFRMVKDDAFYMLKIRKLDRKDKGVYKIVVSVL